MGEDADEKLGIGVLSATGGAGFLASLISGLVLIHKNKHRMEKFEPLANGESPPQQAAKVDFNAGLDRVSLSVTF